MGEEQTNTRLSQIATVWDDLRRACSGQADEARAAQEQLLKRYDGAIRRYLSTTLGDPHAADDLTQEFGLRLMRGAYQKADPERGRFRDYVKGVLRNLARTHYRASARKAAELPAGGLADADSPAAPDEEDRRFDESWRAELLARGFQALAVDNPLFAAVLGFERDHPGVKAPETARQLSVQLGRPLTPDAVRQARHRGRLRFSELLLDEVLHSLKTPTRQEAEDELAELDLLKYCRAALDQYFGAPAGG
jgi:RNA polymerase sigma-70 factor (ECF subfamily)